MRVGCVQFAPEFGEITRNIERAADLVRGVDADLLVLPELATTGYQFADRAEALSLAEEIPGGPATAAFTSLATEKNVHLCFGIAERAGDRLYNSAVLVGPGGLELVYRKAHLFLHEKDVFDPGSGGFPVADLPGGTARVGILICFDWIFPEAARALALQGAELILHPSNLVLAHCQTAMVTRSLENGVFSLTANRIGEENRAGRDRLSFTGKSQVLSPRGERIASLGTEEGVAVVEIDPAEARNKHVTITNSVLEDRRPELYGLLTDDPTGDRR